MSDELSHLICAVDGGGSGCRVGFARCDGTEIARASGGPANFATNKSQTVRNVEAAISEAAGSAGLDADAIAGATAHIGLAGILGKQDGDEVARHLPFASCVVTDDRPTSVAGALGARDGALLAVGTGTFVALRHGTDIRYFGGWGFELGDQASGAWLGRAALEATLLAGDGLQSASDLTRAITARFDGVAAAMVAFAKSAAPSAYASFAPMVAEAAGAGDATALTLMRRGADYLDAALEAGGLGGDDVVCLTGGLGTHYAPFLNAEARTRIVPAKGTALDGALRLARARVRGVPA